MAEKMRRIHKREKALSRESITAASIEILDSAGEAGLTFQALSKKLTTGPGAIYWHIDNKGALLIAACDAIIADTVKAASPDTTPREAIRSIGLGLFDAIDDHPWVGSALMRAPGQAPALRILEGIGQQIVSLGVPAERQWSAVSALLSYIIGVGGQNAANAQFARAHGLDRFDFLSDVSSAWSQLDPDEYPFARSVAGQLPTHDDRDDFLAGLDFILKGMQPGG